jgi:hypothetical protein
MPAPPAPGLNNTWNLFANCLIMKGKRSPRFGNGKENADGFSQIMGFSCFNTTLIVFYLRPRCYASGFLAFVML